MTIKATKTSLYKLVAEYAAPPIMKKTEFIKAHRSEYQPDFPEYERGAGDTGETGENWDLPSFGNDDGVSGEPNGYIEVKPDVGQKSGSLLQRRA